jgi:hypothetical protein
MCPVSRTCARVTATSRCLFPAQATSKTSGIEMDQKTAQRLIRAAMREGRPPGKYDVFAWHEQQEIRSVVIPWKSFTSRSIELDTVTGEDGKAHATNASPLPNGVKPHAAYYVGSFRAAKSSDAGEF